MSSNSTEQEGGASKSQLQMQLQGLSQVSVPQLKTGGYAAWRPVMENVLMRAGVLAHDYKDEEAHKRWADLNTAVEKWTRADEEASIAYALGLGSGSQSVQGKEKDKEKEKEARRGAHDAINRGKKAYSLLYQALTEELRRLVSSVPQGDAYGLWIWLEKRYQNTEQDNVGELWDQFTALKMEVDESFDEYKARVDQVFGLLTHAKDPPSAGQYCHRLLWKLTARYSPVVLTLRTTDKLKDPTKINWEYIVTEINNHERSMIRLEMEDAAAADGMAMAVIRRNSTGSYGNTVNCYNCGEKGHIARHCREPRKVRGSRYDDQDQDQDHQDTRYDSQRGRDAYGNASDDRQERIQKRETGREMRQTRQDEVRPTQSPKDTGSGLAKHQFRSQATGRVMSVMVADGNVDAPRKRQTAIPSAETRAKLKASKAEMDRQAEEEWWPDSW
jgi:hypothetical protein